MIICIHTCVCCIGGGGGGGGGGAVGRDRCSGHGETNGTYFRASNFTPN